MQIPGNGALKSQHATGRSAHYVPRRAFRRLRTRRYFVSLLVAAAMLSALVVAGAAYAGMRIAATTAAQQRAQADVRTAMQLLGTHGDAPTLSGSDLIVGSGNNQLVLNTDTSVVDQAHLLTGEDVTIYELQGTTLSAISTTLPQLNPRGNTIANTRAQGETLGGQAYDALVGQCAPTAESANACHQQYAGIVTRGATQYVAAYSPLFDTHGNFVGALGAAQPLSAVVGPAARLAQFLGLVVLLLGALVLLIGLRYSVPFTNEALRKLDARLSDVACTAADLEHLSRAQVARSQRQDRAARQISEVARDLDASMEALEQGQAALRDASSEIWAGMSQPGQVLNAAAATRLARQAAVTAGRIGAATEDARDHCRSLIALMNQVIAEGHVLGVEGRETEQRAVALRGAIEKVEIALGAQVVERQYDLPGQPFARRVRNVSRRVGQLLHSDQGQMPAQSMPRRQTGRQPVIGAGNAGGPQSSGSSPRAIRASASQAPNLRPSQSAQWMLGGSPSGHAPAGHNQPGQSGPIPWMRSQTGQGPAYPPSGQRPASGPQGRGLTGHGPSIRPSRPPSWSDTGSMRTVQPGQPPRGPDQPSQPWPFDPGGEAFGPPSGSWPLQEPRPGPRDTPSSGWIND